MATSGNQSKTVQGYAEPAGYVQITCATATGLTVPDFAKYALIQPEAQNVRWRDDGTNPTAAIGQIIVANDTLVYSGKLTAIKFIEVTGTAKVNVTFYK